MKYNLERFKLEHYDMFRFSGPRAGEEAVEFSITDLEHKEVRLSDFRGRWVVLETGSITCSMYSWNVPHIKKLINDYPDVEFLLVYVREAHPGERVRQHSSLDEKINAAKMLRSCFGEERKVLVDSIDGEMHQRYGLLPNSVYVINPDGIVTYRCDWTYIEGLREALENRKVIHEKEHASMKDISNRSILNTFSTMMNGGWLALWDFVKELPFLIIEHKKVDQYYMKHNKLRRQ